MSLLLRSKLGAAIIAAIFLELASLSVAACAPAAAAGMPLISRGVPAYASNGDASTANDADHRTLLRLKVPGQLAYDLRSVPTAQRQKLLVVWYNDATYNYDHAILNEVGYNNLGSYTIEANASTERHAPASGWVVLASVTGNTRHSRQHVVDFSGYSWLRINITQSDGSPQNVDAGFNMDVYDASNGVDGWLFVGDSITASCMTHAGEKSFGNLVSDLKGYVPPQENAGIGGFSSANMLPHLKSWLQDFPGRYVTLNLGTNDDTAHPGSYALRMKALADAVLAAGKIPVIPTIPWSSDRGHGGIPRLNAVLPGVIASYGGKVLAGPELYAYFITHPALLRDDKLHPNEAGCAAYREVWAKFAAGLQ
ncbi:MAG: SGNH/GDSL hydrolase family protein [Proteobacteria bacterium]|nr:SGNH/GDSL hydrolase family protein [Pseudomonadota bacterium]